MACEFHIQGIFSSNYPKGTQMLNCISYRKVSWLASRDKSMKCITMSDSICQDHSPCWLKLLGQKRYWWVLNYLLSKCNIIKSRNHFVLWGWTGIHLFKKNHTFSTGDVRVKTLQTIRLLKWFLEPVTWWAEFWFDVETVDKLLVELYDWFLLKAPPDCGMEMSLRTWSMYPWRC